MPSFSSVAVLSLFALGSTAAPFQGKRWQNDYCMSDNDAQQVATNFGNLIANYNVDLANAALSPNFVDYSESVNTLIDSCPQGSAAVTLPLVGPTFANRTLFELGQGQQQPINFKQLNIWHSCKDVHIRWETTNTANITNVKPVIGLISIEACEAPQGSEYPWIIDTVYSEFDAGAWLQNLQAAGFCPTTPPASSAAANAPPAAPIAATQTPTASVAPSS